MHEAQPLLDRPWAEAGTELAAELRDWLSSGAPQSPDGAFHAWVEEATGAPAFEYPEITGYALTWLAGRPDPTGSERTAAARAAGWLVDRFGRGDFAARAGWDEGRTYYFDVGMIAAGLISHGRRAGDARAEELGRWLAGVLRDAMGDGDSVPALDRPSERSVWSTDGEAHMIKVIQSLLLAGFDAEAARLAGSAARLQQGDGRFVTHRRDVETMLHPHLYAVEGLWMYHAASGDEVALERARRATEWAWGHQLDSGGLPRYVETRTGARGPEQIDLTAQAIRAALALGFEPEGLGRAVERLVAVARPTAAGAALPYQPDAEEVHHNVWVSMFGAQAAALAGGERLEWERLV